VDSENRKLIETRELRQFNPNTTNVKKKVNNFDEYCDKKQMFIFIRGINQKNYPCLSVPEVIELERLAFAKKDIEHCITKSKKKLENYKTILELDDEKEQE